MKKTKRSQQIGRFEEGEAERFVGHLKERLEQASTGLMDVLKSLLHQLGREGFYATATEELISRARRTAQQTKNQVFSVLNIPSQEEMKRLSRKITSLEERLKKLSSPLKSSSPL